MKKSPRVSIVVINYNYERFVEISISSALAQIYADVEVVVVDDASTNSSPEVIKSFGDRVIPVLKIMNAGHGSAFNTGFEHSSGDIVIFLDSDDYLHPDGVSRIVEAFKDGVVLVQSRLDLVDGDGTLLDVYPAGEIPFDNGDVVPLLLDRGRYNSTVTSGLAYSREVLEKVMPMPVDDFARGGDGYLVTVAPLFGKVASVEIPTGAYRLHGANHSQFAKKLAERARWRVEHDLVRYRALERVAGTLGLSVAPDPGLRDPLHIEERLLSSTCEKDVRVCPEDSRMALAMHGVRAIGRARMSRPRKLIFQAWYGLSGIVPRRAAYSLVSWKLSVDSRPLLMRRVVKLARRVLGSGLKLDKTA
jgi:GT2 family glycosyltransferase